MAKFGIGQLHGQTKAYFQSIRPRSPPRLGDQTARRRTTAPWPKRVGQARRRARHGGQITRRTAGRDGTHRIADAEATPGSIDQGVSTWTSVGFGTSSSRGSKFGRVRYQVPGLGRQRRARSPAIRSIQLLRRPTKTMVPYVAATPVNKLYAAWVYRALIASTTTRPKV